MSQQSCNASLQKIIPANEEVYIQKSVYTDIYNLSITTTFILSNFNVCMCVCEREKEDRARQKHIWVSSCHYARSELFSSTLWVPEIKIRLSDLAEQVTLPTKSLG